MAHNSYLRGGLSAWIGTVSAAEFWALDQAQYNSISEAGGTWSAATAIEISGAGMLLSGANHVLSGTLEITGDWTSDTVYSPARVTFDGATGDLTFNSGGDLNVNSGGDVIFATGATLQSIGAPTWAGGWTFTGTLTGSGATLSGTWAGTPTFSGGPIVTNAMTFNGATLAGSSAFMSGQWGGAAEFTGTPIFSGSPILSGTLTKSGAGQFVERTHTGADASDTVDPDEADIYFVPALSAPRTWTLASASANRVVKIVKTGPENFDLGLSAAGTIYGPTTWTPALNASAAGGTYSVELVSLGSGNWRVVQISLVP